MDVSLDQYITKRKSPVIEKAEKFLLETQSLEGDWQKSPWHTALVVMVLSKLNRNKKNILLGLKWLLDVQDNNGSWNNSLWETSHVIAALIDTFPMWKNGILEYTTEHVYSKILKSIEWTLNELEKRISNKKVTSYEVAVSLKALSLVSKFDEDVTAYLSLSDHIENYVSYLLELRKPNGSWDNNVLNTALALDALYHLNVEKFKIELDEGVFFLSEQWNHEMGWGDSRYNAVALLILLKLRKYTRIPKDIVDLDELIENTRNIIKQTQSSVGSWYGRIEATASCLLALIEAGENISDEVCIPLENLSQYLLEYKQENLKLRAQLKKLELEFQQREQQFILETEKKAKELSEKELKKKDQIIYGLILFSLFLIGLLLYLGGMVEFIIDYIVNNTLIQALAVIATFLSIVLAIYVNK